MEKEHANRRVEHFAHGRAYNRGFSPIFLTAAIGALVLVAAFGIKMTSTLSAKNDVAVEVRADAPLTDPISAPYNPPTQSENSIALLAENVESQIVQSYAALQHDGTFSNENASLLGQSLAKYVKADVQYRAINAEGISTDPDISVARMLKYRSDLGVLLKSIASSTQPEFEMFALYLDTHDPQYLDAMRASAKRYRAAAEASAKVVVPKDAIDVQMKLVNSFSLFASVLDSLADHADDPFASTALLKNYNAAESEVFTAFNSLARYFRSKV